MGLGGLGLGLTGLKGTYGLAGFIGLNRIEFWSTPNCIEFIFFTSCSFELQSIVSSCLDIFVDEQS